MVKVHELMGWLENFEGKTDVDAWYDQMDDEMYLIVMNDEDIDNPHKFLI